MVQHNDRTQPLLTCMNRQILRCSPEIYATRVNSRRNTMIHIKRTNIHWHHVQELSTSILSHPPQELRVGNTMSGSSMSEHTHHRAHIWLVTVLEQLLRSTWHRSSGNRGSLRSDTTRHLRTFRVPCLALFSWLESVDDATLVLENTARLPRWLTPKESGLLWYQHSRFHIAALWMDRPRLGTMHHRRRDGGDP